MSAALEMPVGYLGLGKREGLIDHMRPRSTATRH
jgi:hypothetical protein